MRIRVHSAKLMFVLFGGMVSSLVVAQGTEEKPQPHQTFRGEGLTSIIEQERWYRDIRSLSWQSYGLSQDRLLGVLAEIESESGSADFIDHDHKTWVAVWETAARNAAARAEKTSGVVARDLYTEAYIAYMVASYPHNDANLATRLLTESVRHYRNAGNLNRPDRITELQISGDGFATIALLHLPEGDGPFPVVMLSGGIDVTLVEHGTNFDKYFEPAGVAYITFDIPAGGLNQGMLLEPGNSSAVHHAVFAAIEGHPLLDADRVAALSSSGGGVSIVNFAIENQDLKAAVSRCGLVDGPTSNPAILAKLPQMTLDTWATRIGADPANLEDIAEKSLPHSLVASGLLDGTVRTRVPLLALNTHADLVAPPADMLATARVSENGQVAFFGRSGHCPKDSKAEAFAAQFMLSKIINKRE